MTKFLKIWSRFSEDNSGHIAVMTAIIALPMMIGVSVALDAHRIDRDRTRLKSALDGAAIAAITQQTINPAQRADYAKERFWLNVRDIEGVSLQVTQSDSHRVELEGHVKVPTLLTGVVGRDIVDLKEISATELVKGATVCMLALDPDSARSFEVTRGAILDANCSIQVNSISKQAAVMDHGGLATAESYCIGGGATGDFLPYVNTECSVVQDPYAKIEIPEPGACVDKKDLYLLMNDWRSGRNSVEDHAAAEELRVADAEATGQFYEPTFFKKNTLAPGNYCNGLVMEGKEFELKPGVYHISGGSLVFGSGTELQGEGVTFVLHDKVNIEIRDGSILNIKAPKDGPLRGLVLAQEMEDKSLTNPTYPNVTSTITSGGQLNLLGTVYLPTHKIEFLGGSLSKTRAPATSFIAHQISMSDGADISVDVDHVSADIPPILPRSDESARLVR
ncbi:pilus assembly protein [Hellea sp.]|nr:pilus assembly protein [Hellea sp.]